MPSTAEEKIFYTCNFYLQLFYFLEIIIKKSEASRALKTKSFKNLPAIYYMFTMREKKLPFLMKHKKKIP